MFGWRAANELMWAIELTIMFERYCTQMRIARGNPLVDVLWLKKHWVKASMRLGDDAIIKILRTKRNGGRYATREETH